MYLRKNDDEQLLVDTVRGVLGRYGDDVQKGLWGTDWNRDAYRRLGDLGMLEPAALDKDRAADPRLAVQIAEELGRAGAILPLFSSIGWVASLLGLLDPAHERLPALLAGKQVACLAAAEGGLAQPGLFRPTTVVEVAGDRARVRGRKHFVPFLASADLVVVTASRGEDLVLVAVPGEQLASAGRVMSSATGDLLGDVEFDVEVASSDVLASGSVATSALRRTWAHVLLLQAAYLLGGADRAIQLTADHVKVREQFGQPIGAFQAVQHHVADSEVAVRSARLLVGEQAWRQSLDDDLLLPRTAETKAWIAEKTQEVARRAHELQGGLGAVDAHETSRLFLRNLAVAVEDGGPPELWTLAAELRHVPPSIEVLNPAGVSR